LLQNLIFAHRKICLYSLSFLNQIKSPKELKVKKAKCSFLLVF
jgi:hypothetical protein